MQTKAAVARARGGPLSLETIDIEDPRPDEILVRIVAAGVCHTDIVARDGVVPAPLPIVLGHEGAGVVERVGAAITKVQPGDHVVLTFDSCGRCPSCLERHLAYCHDLAVRNFFGARPDGSSGLSQGGDRIHGHFFAQSSFAGYALSREANTVKVDKSLPLERLGPLGCGVQTGAGAVMNVLQVKAGDSFAVYGAGAVGLSAVMAAKVVGAGAVIAIDTNDERLDLALKLGATHALNPKRSDVIAEVMRITGHGVQHALDTTGAAPVIKGAVLALAPRGACGVLGASPFGSEIVLDEVHFMGGGRRLLGIVEGDSNPDVFIPLLAELNRQGLFPFERLIHYYELDQINEAIRDSETGRTVKPVVRMR